MKTTHRKFSALAAKADAAGQKASSALGPVPINGDYEKGNLAYCGFAWIRVRPATSSFAKWAKANIDAEVDDYKGGLLISSPLTSQSLVRNEAYCEAYAEVLNKAGIKAYVTSQVD
jgi:hypothetical protein